MGELFDAESPLAEVMVVGKPHGMGRIGTPIICVVQTTLVI